MVQGKSGSKTAETPDTARACLPTSKREGFAAAQPEVFPRGGSQNLRTSEQGGTVTPPLRVLLMEDEPSCQAYASNVLKRLGLVVDVVTNGVEAIEALSRVEYALVVMDCLMPVMDGLEATRRIRAGSTNVLNPDIPIIGYTAHVMPDNITACHCAGMND